MYQIKPFRATGPYKRPGDCEINLYILGINGGEGEQVRHSFLLPSFFGLWPSPPPPPTLHYPKRDTKIIISSCLCRVRQLPRVCFLSMHTHAFIMYPLNAFTLLHGDI